MEVTVNNLYFRYEDEEKDVLKNVSFVIHDKEWISIIGHNGSGKSTLSKLLIGILSPTEGSITYDNLELNDDNLYEIRKHIGIVYQNPDNQFVATSVEDDIAFGLENRCVESQKMASIINESLRRVNMLEYKESSPSSLSGGQKQRVAIAGILALNTDIIILDEATSMLDPKGREDFINLVKELKNAGKTILMITHDMEEALLSDRCIVLNNGEIVKDDSTINVLNDYDTLKMAKLEMPSELYMYHHLKNENYSNKEVLDALWELALKK